MARTTVPIESVPTGFPLTKEVVVWADSDAANGNRFAHTGKEILIAHNTGVGARTLTPQSVAINGRQDPLHNIAISLAAGEVAMFNFRGDGWKQPSGEDAGYVQINGNNAELKLLVIRNPA